MHFSSVLLIAAGIVFLGGFSPAWACDPINPNDWLPDDSGLNCRLDAGGTIVLDPGYPGYIIDSGLIISRNGTRLVSSGAPNQTATLIAGQNLFAYMMTTPPWPVHNIEISYITFSGMVDEPGWRLRRHCTAPYDTPGNVGIWGDWTYVHNSEFKHALCGSGLKVLGSNYTINDNYIAYNGRDRFSSETGDRWADGITALSCFGGTISNNTLVDNTDIDIVIGGGNCSVYGNQVWHGGKYAFAGIQVGWFQEGAGNHSGAVIQDNRIESVVPNRLGMGLLVGFHPWDSAINVSGGSVLGNWISGAVINLILEGAYNVRVQNNIWSAPSTGWAGPGDNPTCYIKGLDYAAYDFSGDVQNGHVAFSVGALPDGRSRLVDHGRRWIAASLPQIA